MTQIISSKYHLFSNQVEKVFILDTANYNNNNKKETINIRTVAIAVL